LSIFEDDLDADNRRDRFTKQFPPVTKEWETLDAPYLWHTHADEMDGIRAAQ